MTAPLEEILQTYETAKHYNSDLTPETFAPLYRLHEAGTLDINQSIKTDKIIASQEEKTESAAKAGLTKLLNRIHNPQNYICASTGFTVLDELLDGGFYAGL